VIRSSRADPFVYGCVNTKIKGYFSCTKSSGVVKCKFQVEGEEEAEDEDQSL
jgi:hypothetical protein